MGPEWLIPLGIIVLLFGGSQLPKLARSLGEAKNEFEKGTSGSANKADVTVTRETTVTRDEQA